MGSPSKDGDLTTFPAFIGGTLCLYESVKKNEKFVSVMFRTRDSEAAAMKIFKHNYDTGVPSTVIFHDLGDEALWCGREIEPNGGLHIRIGGHLIDIKVNKGDNDAENMAGAVELAKQVVKKVD